MRVSVNGCEMLTCTLQCIPCIIYDGLWYEHVFMHDAMRVSVNGCEHACVHFAVRTLHYL